MLLDWLGWVGNLLLIFAAWRIAYKDRWALLIGAAGGYIWAVKATLTCQWDLLTIEIILSSLQVFSWWKWGKLP